MYLLLEAILEPIAEGIFEGVVLFVSGGFSVWGTESRCKVQTIFGDDVWWNSNSQLSVGRQLRQPLSVFNTV